MENENNNGQAAVDQVVNGSEVFDTPDPQEEVVGHSAATEQVVEKPVAQAPQGIDPKTLEGILDTVLKKNAPVQQQQFSQEDFDRRMNVARATPEMVTALLGELPPERIPAVVNVLNQLMHMSAKQAVTMAGYQHGVLKEEFEQRLTPLQQHHMEQKLIALKNEFFTTNKDLVGYDVITDKVVDDLKKEGWNNDGKRTKKETFDEVAKRAKDLIKSIPGLAQATQQSQNGTSRPNGQSKMSALTGAGQGAGAASRQNSPNLPKGVQDGLDVFK